MRSLKKNFEKYHLWPIAEKTVLEVRQPNNWKATKHKVGMPLNPGFVKSPERYYTSIYIDDPLDL